MEENTDKTGSPEGKNRTFKDLLQLAWRYLVSLVRIQEDTDIEATIANINKGVNFRGVNAWVLCFAIVIASVGLNVNSTAVIIGAMLISPLMGPINGLGLAVGIYDWDLLKRSLRNLGAMVLISLCASTLYFLLSPLGDAQSELLARTRPTIFDVLIATFGGLAGIVASSRKEQPAPVIAGVAIATALMPPLCTAGFGLATLQFKYFIGAFYLFFINSFFIALSTFVIVRYLHFPKHSFVDKHREKVVKRSIIVIAILVLVPSCITAISVVRESYFNSHVNKFLTDIRSENLLKNAQIVSYEIMYDRDNPTLELSVLGDEVTQAQIDTLHTIMRKEYGLNTTELKIRQSSFFNANDQAQILENLVRSKDEEIGIKDAAIAQLTDSIRGLQTGHRLFADKTQVIGEKYKDDIASISIVDVPYFNPSDGSSQKIPTIYIVWKDSAPHRDIVLSELNKWAPALLGVQNVQIVTM